MNVLLVTGGFYKELASGHLQRCLVLVQRLFEFYETLIVTFAINNKDSQVFLSARLGDDNRCQFTQWSNLALKTDEFSLQIVDCLDYFYPPFLSKNIIIIDSSFVCDSTTRNTLKLNYFFGSDPDPRYTFFPFLVSRLAPITSLNYEPPQVRNTRRVMIYLGGDPKVVTSFFVEVVSKLFSGELAPGVCFDGALFDLELFWPDRERVSPIVSEHISESINLPVVINSDFNLFKERCMAADATVVCTPGIFGFELLLTKGEGHFFSTHPHQERNELLLSQFYDNWIQGPQLFADWLSVIFLPPFEECGVVKSRSQVKALWKRVVLPEGADSDFLVVLLDVVRFAISFHNCSNKKYVIELSFRDDIALPNICAKSSDSTPNQQFRASSFRKKIFKMDCESCRDFSNTAIYLEALTADQLFAIDAVELADVITKFDLVDVVGNIPGETAYAWLTGSVATKGEVVFGIREYGALVGVISCRNLNGEIPQVGIFSIFGKYRGKGFGREAINLLKCELLKMGFTSFMISGFDLNEPAMALYESEASINDPVKVEYSVVLYE